MNLAGLIFGSFKAVHNYTAAQCDRHGYGSIQSYLLPKVASTIGATILLFDATAYYHPNKMEKLEAFIEKYVHMK